MKKSNLHIQIVKLKHNVDISKFEMFKFKDLGYLTLEWQDTSGQWNYHGFITVDQVKTRLGLKQYKKFCEGKRIFHF
jgi:hypothetical protein